MKRLAVALTSALAFTGAHAGALGDGRFENDDAMDWVGECVQAASLGKPSPSLPADLEAWLAGQPRSQIAAQAALAERALTKIEDAWHSELRQLWSEGKTNQWLTKVRALQSRIGGKLAGWL